MTTTTGLPDKASGLVRLAVSDFEKCVADPDVTINMSSWYQTLVDGSCAVCLAGAIMLKTTGVHLDERNRFDFDQYDEDNRSKFLALEYLRTTLVWFVEQLGLDTPEVTQRAALFDSRWALRGLPVWSKHPYEFLGRLNEAADLLEELGL